ncbi:CMP-N-acetylneuraminate-beta-galactosamide-alpha-2,3-sialyltransferase 4 isoform X2 [Lagopus muta]|uniref:CMP-N-acetylneuraminate-beta-galactosamide- alpha-2,3-sialyltransferase 4 isoform X2 n=1 Tax=Lagopus muta TaxID=64668 RepID=UPI0020A14116|nr:CMP-N-acetylneuraminate-beta-galactosamide-alpha-2,3-sialyltransferase 4 isoform X2 [Lagopus muta]
MSRGKRSHQRDGGREDGPIAQQPPELLPSLLTPRGRTVSSSGCDESPGPRLMPALLIKMINKSRGKILGVLALFLVMVWYSIYREDSFYFPVQENKTVCPIGEVERKAAQLIGNYSRDRPLFLQLKDYFWVRTPSLYELPYGTKGSEDVLLRLLSVTSYPLPESIQSLKCRRCVVVGNGHRLRNSSIGDTINTYDVVIRLNNAPVHGYEQDVGSKTTMRLFYPESAHFDPQAENNPDTLLVLVPFKPMDFQWMEAILNDKKRVRKGFWKQPPLIWDASPEQVRILNPYYMEVTAAKLLSLPMKQPRKVKQALGTLTQPTRSKPSTTTSRSHSSPWLPRSTTSHTRRWPSSACWSWDWSRTSRTSECNGAAQGHVPTSEPAKVLEQPVSLCPSRCWWHCGGHAGSPAPGAQGAPQRGLFIWKH